MRDHINPPILRKAQNRNPSLGFFFINIVFNYISSEENSDLDHAFAFTQRKAGRHGL